MQWHCGSSDLELSMNSMPRFLLSGNWASKPGDTGMDLTSITACAIQVLASLRSSDRRFPRMSAQASNRLLQVLPEWRGGAWSALPQLLRGTADKSVASDETWTEEKEVLVGACFPVPLDRPKRRLIQLRLPEVGDQRPIALLVELGPTDASPAVPQLRIEL